MGLTARVPSTAKTNLYTPAIFANEVMDIAKPALVCVDAVNNEWASGLVKGDILYIPKKNSVTATEVVVNTKGSATNPLNTTGVTLTMDVWYEAPVDIDDMTRDQSQIPVASIAAEEAAIAVKVKADLVVATLFSTLNGSSVYGSDGQTLDDDLLLYLFETLNEAGVPLDGKRSLIIDPSGLTDMLKVDKFIAAQYASGALAKTIVNGIIGTSPLYGCTVRMTNQLVAATTGAYAVMLHRNAIACRLQFQKAWMKEYPELHTTRYQSEILMGAIEANDTWGIPFYTRKA
jgi:hypothetical protein